MPVWYCNVDSVPSSMLTCVMGLPADGYIGLALMSIVDLDAAADVLSALGAATLAALGPLISFFAGGAFTASLDVVLSGMFRMSLYFDCLYNSISIVRGRHARRD